MRLPPFIAAALLTAGILFAQTDPALNIPAGDPPSRVARLNFLDGNVSYQPASLDAWTAATLNYPLTTGDHVYSDVNSHAEMHIGPNALRLGSQSNFGFLNLDDRTVQVRFTEGALEIRLRQLDDDDLYEVDTPQGAISLLRTGDYRIETDPDRNATMLTVRTGTAEVTANGITFSVRARQTAFFNESGRPDIRDANPPDAFDSFTDQRNMWEEQEPAPVHVSTEMVGYQDLDSNGSWRNEPDYGWVWAPRARAGWAPYHEGHWAWVAPWGWTWIDDAPWGFAPFHYGRWAYVRAGWVWIPGAVVRRPVYAPALVAFVGGSGVGGSGFGVAWFPLGPREPFYPAYHVSRGYVQQVNITHVNVTNIDVTNVRYVNQSVPGAVVAVPQAGFASARSVASMARPVSVEQLRGAQVSTTAPQIAPQRESYLGNARTGGPVAQPPQTLMSRPVVVKSALPAGSVNRAPVRMSNAPAQVAPAPPSRMDSRPPTVLRPQAPAFIPAPQAPQAPREVSRPAQAPAVAPAQAPEVRRPPAQEKTAREKPAPAKDEKKAKAKRETKEEKKP